MEQRIEELSSEDRADLEKHRRWLLGHYANDPEGSYAGYAAKLNLINVILESGWVEPHETRKLQSLGVAFGDALAEHLGLTWVAILDEYGRDPALLDEGSKLKLFPLTMISKRVEQGEEFTCEGLFAGLVATVGDIRRESGN